jgi:phenylalanyl-tRNA synthetase beta chain
LLAEFAAGPNFTAGKIKDVYPEKVEPWKIEVSVLEINKSLGTAFTDAKVANILKKIHFDSSIIGSEEGRFEVIVPPDRLDLRIKEDIIEEVGRIYGYEKVISVKPIMEDFIPAINKNFYYTDKIRSVLSEMDFSEISTYAFTETGDVEVENPIASDKKFLRNTLAGNMQKALELNIRNAPLLGLQTIRLFEIGKVFEKEREYISLCLGVSPTAKKKSPTSKDILFSAEEKVSDALGVTLIGKTASESVIHFDLESVIQKLKEPSGYKFPESGKEDIRYHKISAYPFMLRDIAVFAPTSVPALEVYNVIKEHSGELLVQDKLFDVFEKTFEDGTKKISYAFRLVFQSQEKTLSDEEVNVVMEKITAELNEREGWKVR